MAAPYLLLHRRPHLRQSGAPGRRRRAAARRRHDDGAARAFPRRVRLDPHRADVRAARPRHDVGLDPLSADARRLRRRHPVHRDLRLPADVRPRHHRHGDHGDRARAGARRRRRACCASTRRPGWSIAEYRAGRRLCRGGAHHQRAVLPLRRGARRSTARRSASSTVDVAYGGNFYAIVEPQENFRDMADYSAGDLIALEPGRAPAAQREIHASCIPRTRRSTGSRHILWTGSADDAEARCAQRRVLRRQGDRPLALRHRHLGAHGAAARQGQAQGRRRLRARIDHRLAVQGPRRGGDRGRRASRPSCPRSAAGRA